MALTRATATIVDGMPQHENTTTSWIDQNQTYTSHESHQVFLRDYVREDGVTYSTGKLLSGYGSTIYELRRELVDANPDGHLLWSDVLDYHASGSQLVSDIEMRFDNFQMLIFGENVDYTGDGLIGVAENLQSYLYYDPTMASANHDLPYGQINILEQHLQTIDADATLRFVRDVPSSPVATLTLTLGNAPEWGAYAGQTLQGADALAFWFNQGDLSIGDQIALPAGVSLADPEVFEAVNAILTASVNNNYIASNVAIDVPNITVAGGIGNWGDVKHQAIEALGLKLNDFDVHDVPLLKADPYGKFIPGENGYAQVAVTVSIVNATTGATVSVVGNAFVEGVDGGLDIHALTTANLPSGFPPLPALGANQAFKVAVIGTGHAFLNDISHHAAPGKYDANGDGFKE